MFSFFIFLQCEDETIINLREVITRFLNVKWRLIIKLYFISKFQVFCYCWEGDGASTYKIIYNTFRRESGREKLF